MRAALVALVLALAPQAAAAREVGPVPAPPARYALLPDVETGDQIAGVHRPGAGARFYLNGRRLGEIDSAAFSRAFFSILLDPRTREPELRAALIGQR